MLDAEDGLSGVDIDLTIEEDQSGANDDHSETESESETRQTPPIRHNGTAPRRIQSE